ncbi:MAG: hypothetical protein Q9221_005787 [Calogaya cf. arnoldii]
MTATPQLLEGFNVSDESDQEPSDNETAPSDPPSEGSDRSEGSDEDGTDVSGSNEAAAGSDPPELGEGDVEGGDNEEGGDDNELAAAIHGGEEGMDEYTADTALDDMGDE